MDPNASPRPWAATNLSQHRQLIFFLAVAALVLATLWRARGALLPFVLTLLVAYLIAPQVGRLQRAMPPRLRDKPYAKTVAILVVYLAFVAILAIAGALILPPVLEQGRQLLEAAPQGFDALSEQFRGLLQRYERLPASVRHEIEKVINADTLHAQTDKLVELAQTAVLGTWAALSGTLSWILALLIVPIWLFYILSDTSYITRGSLGLVPREIRSDLEAGRIIVDRVLSAYIRGQLVIALIIGVLLAISLWALGVDYALLLGLVAGSLGFIPFIGAILGAIPAVIVAAFTSLSLALKVILAIFIIQQIDGVLISPRVQGQSVALRPALVMVVLVIGQQVMGFTGLLLAVPLTAILRDIAHYGYLRLGHPSPTPVAALTEVGYGQHVTGIMLSGGDLEAA